MLSRKTIQIITFKSIKITKIRNTVKSYIEVIREP